ncbi:hypothetical protein PoMZ_12730 [Pyricularia oryzae]|uniref:Uncharacterized protein n=1 Tax=Pyricularia oryzae TaxID=318829 RepID=A0A4P7NTE6_PYROR|nr:hypothetical protein PoMZ_12730 [Pyricularia oryzae]
MWLSRKELVAGIRDQCLFRVSVVSICLRLPASIDEKTAAK